MTRNEQIRSYEEKREEYAQKMRDLSDKAKEEKRDFSEEERSAFCAHQAEIKKLNQKIEDERALAELDNPKFTAVPNPNKEKRELGKYSFARAIRISMGAEKRDGLEYEMHQEAVKEARDLNQSINGFGVPEMILSQKRDFTVTGDSGTKGGVLVPTEKKGFIDALMDNMVLSQLGASRITGVTGNGSIPKGGLFSASFKGETAEATSQDHTISDLTYKPHRLPAVAKPSKQLIMQSGIGMENYVRTGLMNAIMLAVQDAAINGSGTDPIPRGILNTSGIGAVAIGTNGGAITRSKLVELITKIKTANALKGNLNFLSNAKVSGALMDTKVDAGSGKFVLENDKVLGYNYFDTNQVPSNLTKGTSSEVCSALLFANWADLMILQFGGLDITTDPVTLSEFGKVKIVINSFWDTLVTRPESFAAIQDITTT